jgi:hypothetical protein
MTEKKTKLVPYRWVDEHGCHATGAEHGSEGHTDTCLCLGPKKKARAPRRTGT